jgi:phosphopantothenoylcysteine decarboxylase/phosphopantothenate--cysteine ligase
MKKSTILLGVSGSIAAYKSIELAKLLLEHNFDIEIVLSRSAAEFVSPLTLRSIFPGKVYLHDDLLGERDKMLHISLAKAADLVLIAPASANMIAKIANGYADCLLSNICLATQVPIIIAPAMNKIMWENKLVQENIDKLEYIIGPASGVQACGDVGLGRMLEPVEILKQIKNFYLDKIFEGKKILITAGPTVENIDPVRFISNHSSGKMGYAIAETALKMGAEVTLISGPTALKIPSGVNFIQVTSADEMLKASIEHAPNSDIFISTAAVTDYKVEKTLTHKLKKKSEILHLSLTPNPDILKHIKQNFPQIFAVGFAAETNNFEEYGLKKLNDKKLDMIAINDVSNGKVFGQNFNELHIITKDKKQHFLAKTTKKQISQQLLTLIHSYIIDLF